MKKGEYYAIITVPNNFTECLNSASKKDKQIATITYMPNQASNYLATQIVNSAVKTMELNLEEKINSKIAESLAEKLESVPDSLQKIADGADQILDGSQSLNTGLEQINSGTKKLNNSYTEFDNGIKSAYEGSKSVDKGLEQITSGTANLQTGSKSLNQAISQISSGVDSLSKQGCEGIDTLTKGITSLNQGAESLNKGVNDYVDGTVTLEASVNKYINSVNEVNEKTKQLLKAMSSSETLSSNPELAGTVKALQEAMDKIEKSGEQIKAGEKTLIQKGATLKQGAKSVSEGTKQLSQGSSGLNKITEGIGSLKTALAQVQAGTKNFESGVESLSTGTKTLKNGTSSLTNGLEKLSGSSTTVKEALKTLNNGTASAYEGSQTLVSGVEKFKNEINSGIQETNEQLENLEGIEKFAENPVAFETDEYGKVDSYGVAFTPLFLCIGLWVGALMAYVVLYYDQKNRFSKLGSLNQNKLLQNILYIAIGAVQGIITAGLLKMGLGFEVQTTLLYYISNALIGITFMSIIQFLIRNFGDVGKFIALIILVLQLAASGGTFPVETINKSFQKLTPYLPMTYSIKLLRELLVPTDTNFKSKYIWILIAITMLTLGITYCVDVIKVKKGKDKMVNKA